jgi:hypothetical protein
VDAQDADTSLKRKQTVALSFALDVWNVNVQGCTGCQKAVVEVTGNRKSSTTARSELCRLQMLPAKVHFPVQTLDTESKKVQEMYPEFCWLNKESENYRG